MMNAAFLLLHAPPITTQYTRRFGHARVYLHVCLISNSSAVHVTACLREKSVRMGELAIIDASELNLYYIEIFYEDGLTVW